MMNIKIRDKEIYELRKQGITYKNIAKKFNISNCRVQQVYRKIERQIRFPYIFNTRITNALKNCDTHFCCLEHEHCQKAIVKLYWYYKNGYLERIRHLGKKNIPTIEKYIKEHEEVILKIYKKAESDNSVKMW